MTEVEYKREMNRNYMVIKPEPRSGGRYAAKMLSENKISGLLPFHEKKLDGQSRYYFDITSRQPLGRILEYRAIAGWEIRSLISAILHTLKQMERYLLDEGQLNLKPEFIYVEPESFRCCLCLIPGRSENLSEELCELAKYLLDHVNHTDAEAVVLAFGIFQESRKMNFGLESLERFANKGKGEQEGTGFKEDEKAAWEWTEEGKLTGGENNRLFNDPIDTGEGFPRQNSLPILFWIAAGLMLFVPLVSVMLLGTWVLWSYKWIYLGVELILLLLLLSARYREHGGKETETKKHMEETAPAPAVQEESKIQLSEDNRSNAVFRHPQKPIFQHPQKLTLPESSDQLPGGWEALLRAEEGREEESNAGEKDFQTVLLSNAAVNINCRRLVSVQDGEEIPIQYFPFLIGKNKELADYCLDFPGVSRLHMRIDQEEEGYLVTDLNSTNGTKVNDQVLDANASCRLPEGAVVEIAGIKYRFL